MTQHITIRKAPGKWAVRSGGAILGETTNALELTEGDYPPVIYFPRADIAMAFMDTSAHSTHCPHKGDASYFDIVNKSATLKNAVWSYENPKSGVEQIMGYLAFDLSQGVLVEQI